MNINCPVCEEGRLDGEECPLCGNPQTEPKIIICNPTEHKFIEKYYGWECELCLQFVPFGSEYWL